MHRQLRIGAAGGSGSQSYVLAAFSGSSVYVMLREAHVWNCAGSTTRLVHGGIPIGLRILLGAGASVGVRALAWQREDELFLTMGECADANCRWVNALAALAEGMFRPVPPK